MQVLYEPGIVIVGQGRKRGYLGDQVYTYDAHATPVALAAGVAFTIVVP